MSQPYESLHPPETGSSAPEPAPPATPAGRKGAPGTPTDRIAESIVITGALAGRADLTVNGRVQGVVELREHVLTVGEMGRIEARVFAKSVVVLGEVMGDVIATGKVALHETASVEGTITTPRLTIVEGARFRGRVAMSRPGTVSAMRRPVPRR